jgi:hypothetical protein
MDHIEQTIIMEDLLEQLIKEESLLQAQLDDRNKEELLWKQK